MAAKNFMGFKKCSGIPMATVPKAGIYDPLIKEVATNGGTYMLDVNDRKRAYSLAATLRQNIKRAVKYDGVRAGVRGTIVFITKEECDG